MKYVLVNDEQSKCQAPASKIAIRFVLPDNVDRWGNVWFIPRRFCNFLIYYVAN